MCQRVTGESAQLSDSPGSPFEIGRPRESARASEADNTRPQRGAAFCDSSERYKVETPEVGRKSEAISRQYTRISDVSDRLLFRKNHMITPARSQSVAPDYHKAVVTSTKKWEKLGKQRI